MPATTTPKVRAELDDPEGDDLDMEARDRKEAESGSRGANDFEYSSAEMGDDEDDDEGDEAEPETKGEDDDAELEDARSAAVEAGMSESDAAGFKSAKDLHKITAALRRQADGHRAALETAKAGSVSGARKGADAGRDDGSGEGDLAAEIEAIIEEEEVSPKMAKLLKGLAKSHSELRAQVNKPPREVPVHGMDFMVGELGKGYDDLFGEGPGEALPTGSPKRANRIKVIEEAERYVESERKAGRPIPTAKKAYAQAVQTVFGEASRAIESSNRGDAAKRRSGKFLTRPAGSAPSGQKPGRRAAVAGIRKWFGDRGMSAKDDGADE